MSETAGLTEEDVRERYVLTLAYLEHIEAQFRDANFDRWENAHKGWCWFDHIREPFVVEARATLAREDDAMRRARENAT